MHGKEVIRYDCTHGYAHKDCYNIKGKCRKINLYLDYEEALTFADDDINENWGIYEEEFNHWAREAEKSVAEKDNPVAYVTITEMKPVRSRIEKLHLELVG